MKRNLILLLSLAILLCGTTSAQTAYEPDKGSRERKALLDTLRAPVERDLKQPIVFAAGHLRVQGTWAFLYGSLKTPRGTEPDFRRSIFADEVKAGIFDNNVQGLLRRTGGKWKVITYAVGCTDVCWYGWWQTYRAPKGIFPTTD